MEKFPELDNQQQTDLAWLGAMINGEGYVDVESIKRGDKFYFSPRLSIANTDPAIIVRCTEILRSILVNYYICKTGTLGGKNRQCYSIRVDKLSQLHRLLQAIIPWMVGEKQAKAKLVLDYVQSRFDRTDGKLARNQHSSVPYSDEEKGIVQKLGSWMFNEHTFSEAEMLLRCALDSGRKPENAAEMTASAA
jgi:hypothetical protein